MGSTGPFSNEPRRTHRHGQRGFTLIELLVVIAVLAILAAIVIFNVVGVANRGSSSACLTDTKSVQTASDAYYNDHSQKYPSGDGTSSGAVTMGLLVPAYLHTTPAAGDGTFSYSDSSGTVKASNC